MSKKKKRSYTSDSRKARAAETKNRILEAALKLFEAEGFDFVTIEMIAKNAEVSIPTVYALFQSKLGVLRAIIDSALPQDSYETLVKEGKKKESPASTVTLGAKIARQMYDAERAQMQLFRSAALISPQLKLLEQERETRRYKRQEETMKLIEKSLAPGLSLTQARDIAWAFTGRDLYRLLVIERGWTSDDYEAWLSALLVKTLL